ncbi:SDR family NAD(P)-dependent oxidoreductase [Actinacidiphila rubida]|uniref:SDR family NAD(P)-dependent oxidoreductase n=1 Tax=Actinacidiphila rubida TaxID=310780 RepID=UPI001C40784E|nr:SDR family oxidoreductase [Actinacidiphila rubida]
MTGAGRGIGRAVATALADAGADLVLLARSKEQLASAADEIRARGRSAELVVADLSDPSQLRQAGRAVMEAGGVIDILINNAATVAPLGPTERLAPEEFVSSLVLNVVSAAALSSAVLSGMRERGWGRIVNLSSGLAARPASMPGGNVYVSTKAALEAHTLNLAAETGGTGVTVNAYRPGIVDTAMQAWIREQDPRQIGDELHRQFVTSYEQGRLITAERSAASLLGHLGTEDNGQVWTVGSSPTAL